MSHNNFQPDQSAAAPLAPLTSANGHMRFVTLGRLALLSGAEGVEVVGSQRRKLALLAYLALARRPVQRDTLVEMFWGDEEEDRARHSLSNALSYLRRILGPAAIAVRKSEVALAPDTPMTVDAVQLLAAAAQRDHARVIDFYEGAFFEGVYITESVSLDEWVGAERARIDGAFVKACDAECMAQARESDWSRCASVARKWIEVAPTSTEAALHLLNSLRASKTPEGRRAALDEYNRLRERLRREYDLEPNARVVQLAAQISARLEADHVAVVADAAAALGVPVQAAITVAHPATAESAQSPTQSSQPDIPRPAPPSVAADIAPLKPSAAHGAPHSVRSRRIQIGAGIATIVAVTVGALLVHQNRRAGGGVVVPRPLIVVTDVANLRGDTASEWLEDGLSQMITAELGRSNGVEVVTPARVRDTRLRAELPITGVLSPDAALDIARRLGATLLIRGGFTHGAGVYVLDVDVRETSTGNDLQSFTVRGGDPMALADQASGRILASSAGGAAGPRFADIETSNVAAYQHFVRALQADAEGRRNDSYRELDEAIALDSGFGSALSMRAGLAQSDGDTRTLARLAIALKKARFTARDLLVQAIDSATHNGESGRAEQLAQQIVNQYPHDPRSYSILASMYMNRGEWAPYESTVNRQLALDSLAAEAGDGPCVPCSAYQAIVQGRADRGNLVGAEEAARRWLSLQPDLPGAWASLATPLAYAGRFDAALDADHRAELLSGNDLLYVARTARDLILARRLDAADSLARSWQGDNSVLKSDALDIRILVLRERGRFRESIQLYDSTMATSNLLSALVLEQVDAYGRLGDYASAERLWQQRVGLGPEARTAEHSLHGDAARWFTWVHAIEANSIAGDGDTVRLHSIADSMRTVGARSYYGRDWKLYNHVLGLIAMQGNRYAEAERDFSAARWGSGGWTETVVWLARAQLAEHRPVDAVATLRDAYKAPVDAMGRYQPRSEIDYFMALAFSQAGMTDSARVYADYTRSAWRNADPEIKRMLLSLPPGSATSVSAVKARHALRSSVPRLTSAHGKHG